MWEYNSWMCLEMDVLSGMGGCSEEKDWNTLDTDCLLAAAAT